MGLKDIAIGGLKSWLGGKGYEVKKKTPRKRTTTTRATTATKRTITRKTTAAKTTTKPKATRKVDELDKLIKTGRSNLKRLYETRNMSKDVHRAAQNAYAASIIIISNHLRKNGSTRPIDELDAFVDDVLVSGRQMKSRLKTAIPTKVKSTRQNKLRQRTMTNSKLTRMAKCR